MPVEPDQLPEPQAGIDQDRRNVGKRITAEPLNTPLHDHAEGLTR
jgi:hypothetical protein